MVLKLFLFIPCILNRVYIVLYIVMFLRHRYLSIWTGWQLVVLHCVKEHCMCVSLGGTPYVLFVITVLCIAISCVLWKMYSLIYLKIFAVLDVSCIQGLSSTLSITLLKTNYSFVKAMYSIYKVANVTY